MLDIVGWTSFELIVVMLSFSNAASISSFFFFYFLSSHGNLQGDFFRIQVDCILHFPKCFWWVSSKRAHHPCWQIDCAVVFIVFCCLYFSFWKKCNSVSQRFLRSQLYLVHKGVFSYFLVCIDDEIFCMREVRSYTRL